MYTYIYIYIYIEWKALPFSQWGARVKLPQISFHDFTCFGIVT